MANIIEIIRKQAIEDMFSRESIIGAWEIWHPHIMRFLIGHVDASTILGIGDHLSEIFRTTGTEGRAQGDLAGGGAAWESLVLWYINVCCAGSRVVAIKKKSHVPMPIRDAVSVNYGNLSCNTESDITVLVFPDKDIYTLDNPDFLRRGRVNYEALSYSVAADFNEFEVGVIQCKTNWNDNAQIPMLWDMVYSAGGFRDNRITVGRNNFHLDNLQKFTYSFVTVPTSRMDRVTSSSICVRRVQNLSGGNYWGQVTNNGIADSIKEIFRCYISGFGENGIRSKITTILPEYSQEGLYHYFNLY